MNVILKLANAHSGSDIEEILQKTCKEMNFAFVALNEANNARTYHAEKYYPDRATDGVIPKLRLIFPDISPDNYYESIICESKFGATDMHDFHLEEKPELVPDYSAFVHEVKVLSGR